MNLKLNHLAIALLTAGTLAAISGCVPLMVGGAAMGAMVVSDRRTSGAQIEDETIELRAGSRVREALGESAHINITSYNRQVLITGEVPTEAAKAKADEVINTVPNVKSIVNELAVMGATSLPQRSADVLITGKVKASMVDAKDLFVNIFKVVTERGTVYLMGRVTQQEADRATAVARQTGGVQRVVRIFEIITDEELKRLKP